MVRWNFWLTREFRGEDFNGVHVHVHLVDVMLTEVGQSQASMSDPESFRWFVDLQQNLQQSCLSGTVVTNLK